MIYLNKELQKTVAIKTKNIIHIKTMEELAELINCLSFEKIDIDNLAEEICDVFICLYKLRVSLGIITKKVNINKKYICDMKKCNYTLSNMQKCISKNYLYSNLNNKFFDVLLNTYNVLFFLIDKYELEYKVQQYVILKQDRDRSLLESGKMRY